MPDRTHSKQCLNAKVLMALSSASLTPSAWAAGCTPSRTDASRSRGLPWATERGPSSWRRPLPGAHPSQRPSTPYSTTSFWARLTATSPSAWTSACARLSAAPSGGTALIPPVRQARADTPRRSCSESPPRHGFPRDTGPSCLRFLRSGAAFGSTFPRRLGGGIAGAWLRCCA